MNFIVVHDSLSKNSLIEVLEYLDQSYTPALSKQVEISEYAEKLSEKAKFIFLKRENRIIGLIAYYISNTKSYVSTFGIHKDHHHQGLGQHLFNAYLNEVSKSSIRTIELEVDKSNKVARKFYSKFCFSIHTDNGVTLLLQKALSKKNYYN